MMSTRCLMTLLCMGATNMTNAEERCLKEIEALKRERALTFSTALERDLSKRIRTLEKDLQEYRRLVYGKIEYRDTSGIKAEDLAVIKRLYFKGGLGIDEIADSFKAKYRHSQVRTAILELIKYGTGK